ncbi:ECF RNA polymerase sigma factor SigK [Catelliglobosispora koreensis]|uniref:ECF RNA polymerase sigma factor SigK n=1 Tax=Catelliglobosispora koreensis TaxID=129052 RepID=UPI00035D4751|nr:ECF RNA polymerase sigma factor SigK [Catelliglobosispora koreensis]
MPDSHFPARTWTPQLVPPPPATAGPECPAAALLTQIGRGDESAFARLYDLVIGRVYGLARRVVRDPQMAEDITQEAMTEVWRSAARFDPAKGTGTAWILTITHRRAVDRVRTEQAHTDTTTRLREHADVPYDEVSEHAGARMESAHVRQCLAGLTELQHQAIALAYYQGLTYPQVATLLGAALPTIKSRMRDGLARLRDCLGVEVNR